MASVLPQVQDQLSVVPGSGFSLPPPNAGDNGMMTQRAIPTNQQSQGMVASITERLNAPWRRHGVDAKRWEPGALRPWRRPKRIDSQDTLSTTLPSTAEPMSSMHSPGTRPTSALTLPPATPRTPRGAVCEDDNSPVNSELVFSSTKCPPGCIDPSFSRKVGPPFTRATNQVIRKRKRVGTREGVLPAIGSDGSSPTSSMSPRTRNAPLSLIDASSAPDSHDEPPSDVWSPRQATTEGSKTPREDTILSEEEAGSEARPSAVVNDAIAELSKPNAVWQPDLWVEARESVLESKGVTGLNSLFQCVRQSSERAMQKQSYQIKTQVRHSAGVVDISGTLSQVRKVHWFGRENVDVPDALGDLEGGGAKMMPPPLIICDSSPLEVLESLRKIMGEERPIVLVTEVADFTEAGAAELGRHRSMNPDCLPLRSDFGRFASEAGKHLQSANATMRQHLCAQNDPYVFLCPGVTVFRGSRDEGFPFLPDPHKAHVVAASMPHIRPAIQTVNSREGGSVWYAYKSDHTALLERYNLVGLVGLQASPHAAEAVLTEEGIVHSDEKELPVLIVTALGCGNQGKSPRDAVASILKSWRRRFAPFYHSVYVCCDDRGGGDSNLACYIDEIVNRSLYRISTLESQAADMAAAKAMRWHWDYRELKLSCSRQKMEKAGHICRRVAEGKSGHHIGKRRMTPSSISISVVDEGDSRAPSKTSSLKVVSATTDDTSSVGTSPRGDAKADIKGSLFKEALTSPSSAQQRRDTALGMIRQTRDDFGKEISSMLKSFETGSIGKQATPVASRRESIRSDGDLSSSEDEAPPENALIGVQVAAQKAKPETEETDMLSALKKNDQLSSSRQGSRRGSRMVLPMSNSRRGSRMVGNDSRRGSRLIEGVGVPGGRRSSRLVVGFAAQEAERRRTSRLAVGFNGGENKGGKDKESASEQRSASPSLISSSMMMTSLALAGGLRKLCTQTTGKLEEEEEAMSQGRKSQRKSLLKRSNTLKVPGEKDFQDLMEHNGITDTESEESGKKGKRRLKHSRSTYCQSGTSASDVDDTEEGSSASTSPRLVSKDWALPTLEENEEKRPSRDGSKESNGSPFAPSPVPEEVATKHNPERRASSTCDFGSVSEVKAGATKAESNGGATTDADPTSGKAESTRRMSGQRRRSSISKRKDALLNNLDLPEAVALRGRRGSTGGIQDQVRRMSLTLLSSAFAGNNGADDGERSKEEKKDLYHKMMRRRSSMKEQSTSSIKDAIGSIAFGNDFQVSTMREKVSARRNSFSGASAFHDAMSPSSKNKNHPNAESSYEEERKRMRDQLVQRRNSGAENTTAAAPQRRNSFGMVRATGAQTARASNPSSRSGSKESVLRRRSQEGRLNSSAGVPKPLSALGSLKDDTSQRSLSLTSSQEALSSPNSKKSVQLKSAKKSVEDAKQKDVPAPQPLVSMVRQSSKETPAQAKKNVEDQVNTLALQMEATLSKTRHRGSAGQAPTQGNHWRSSMTDDLDAAGAKEAFAQASSARQQPNTNLRGSLQDAKAMVKKSTDARSSVGAAPAQVRSSVGAAPAQVRSSVGAAPAQMRGSVGAAAPTHSRSSAGTAQSGTYSMADGPEGLEDAVRRNSEGRFNAKDTMSAEQRRRKKGESQIYRMMATSSIRGQDVFDDEDGDYKVPTMRRISAMQGAGVVGARNFHFG